MDMEKKMKGAGEKIVEISDTAASSYFESIPVASSFNPKVGDSDQLKQNDRSSSSSSSTKSPVTESKTKSCKGCLYYSSHFKSDSRNPSCVGLTRSLPNVPQYIVGESEMEASKEGRSLTDFRYACVGYSLYTDRKGKASNGQESRTVLPVCVGLEILVDRHIHASESASATSHIHNREDGQGLPQRRSPKPTGSGGEEFLIRFTRNANLVANGVVKNIYKVGNRIKQSVDDALLPYRRRPK